MKKTYLNLKTNLLFILLMTLITSTYTFAGGPCDAERWEEADNGAVACGNAANPQSGIGPITTYESAILAIGCANAPAENDSITWIQFDAQPFAGTYEFQIVENDVAWALYYTDSPETTTVDDRVHGDCTDLIFHECGTTFSGWFTPQTPNLSTTTNYYLAVWAINNTTLSPIVFKARNGCGEAKCVLQLKEEGLSTTCNNDGTYDVCFDLEGVNGDFLVTDNTGNATDIDPTNGTFTLGTIPNGPFGQLVCVTYNNGDNYDVSIEGTRTNTNKYTCDTKLDYAEDAPNCCAFAATCDLSNTPIQASGCDASVLPTPETDPAQVFTAITNCGALSLTNNDMNQGGAGCSNDPLIIIRRYTLTDDNNTVNTGDDQTATCDQTFHIVDNTLPIVTCPASDLTLDCNAANLDQQITTWLNTAMVTDACDNMVTVANDYDATNFDGCNGTGTQVITFSATDACENIATTCTKTLTIQDDTPPVITCPANDLTLDCGDADLAQDIADWLAEATATDNCSNTVTVTNDYEATDFNACNGTGTETITFSAVDGCNNAATTCTKTLIIQDNTPPTITCPATDLTLPVNGPNNDSDITAWLNTVTATDNCDNNVTITHDYDADRFTDCNNTGTQTVTFTATDDCTLSSTCTKNIIITDDTPPTLNCPASDLVLACGNTAIDTDIATWIATATASDENGSLTVTHNYDANNFSDLCGNTGRQTVTFTAMDACNNPITCTKDIIIEDNTAPIITCPTNDLTLNCSDNNRDQQIQDWLNDASVTDACDHTVTVSHNYTAANFNGCNGTGTQEVTFSATDACSNMATSCTKTLTIQDNTPPTITCPTDDLTLNCDATNLTQQVSDWLNTATATDNCSQTVTVTNNYDVTNFNGCNGTGTQTITFSAVDDCGNAATTCTKTLIIQDNTRPVLTCPATDLTLSCSANNIDLQIQNWLAEATATDNCSNNVTVNNDYDPAHFTGCNGTGNQLITFTAIDNCNNEAISCTKTLTVVDNTPPVFNQAPGLLDLNVSCSNSPVNITPPTATDNCAGPVVVSLLSTTVTNQVCANRFNRILTYQATDACGNTATYTVTVRVNDTSSPTLIQPAQDLTVTCDGNSNILTNWLNNHGGATATDNCGTVQWSHNFTGLPACGTNNSTLVTFTASDGCNSTQTTASLTVIDNSVPIITIEAQDLTVECGTDIETALQDWLTVHGNATATDNCGVTTWTTDYDEATFDAACGATGATIVTFSVTDVCGNTATTTATFTIVDTTNPIFTSFPEDMSFICGANMLTMGDPPTASDNCDKAVNIVFKGENRIDGDCTGNYQLIRTWMVIDDCGNSLTQQQTITFTDTEAPLLSGVPSDVTVACGEDLPALPEVTAWDMCEGNLSVDFEETTTSGSCPTIQTIIRIWTATDNCGNRIEEQQTIKVVDEEAPIFDCPVEIIICAANALFDIPTVTDNCADLNTLTVEQTSGPTPGSVIAEGTTQVCFEAQDLACNVSTCCFNIVFEPLSEGCCQANSGIANIHYTCPGDQIIATTEDEAGNATHLVDPNYGLLYILTTTDGEIIDFNETGIFNEPEIGSYLLYTYSSQTNGSPSSLTNGVSFGNPISQLLDQTNTTCSQLSATAVTVSVQAPLKVTRSENISEGNNGGVTPFFYNEHVIEIEGGTGSYTYQWEKEGYVRQRIRTNPDLPMMNANIHIIYADQATWGLTVTDANGCTIENWKFTNDPTAGGTAAILDVYQVDITGTTNTSISDGHLSIWIEGGCPIYTYTFGGPQGYSQSGTAMNGDEVKLTNLHYGWYTVSITDAGGSDACPDEEPQETQKWLWIPYNTSGSGGGIRGKNTSVETQEVALKISPNPFVTNTTISFNIPTTGLTKVDLFSIDGKHVTTLLNQHLEQQADYQLPFNKEQLAAGIYMVQLTGANQKTTHQKLMITK